MSEPNLIHLKPTMTRYVWNSRVINVVQKETTVGGKKSADGTSELFTEDAGWYIIIEGMGNVSIHVGSAEPDFKKGDKIRFVIERDDL